MRNVLWISSALVGFSVIHSLTAGNWPKRRLKRRLGERLVEGWYRLTYNVFALVTIIPTLMLMAFLPDQVLYRADFPWNPVLRAIQVFGLLGLVGTLAHTDVLRFTGLRQTHAYLTGRPLPLAPEPLQEKGVYSLVRHPLYLFSLMVIWPRPAMTLNVLTFNIGATVYFFVGSLLEEQRLEVTHGAMYRAYRKHVSWFLPWPHFKTNNLWREHERSN